MSGDDALFYRNRGAAYFGLAKYALVLENLNKAIALDPKSAWYVAERGEAQEKLGSKKQAIADYKTSLTLNPDDVIKVFSQDGLKRLGAK